MLLKSPLCDVGWKAPDFALSDPLGNPFTLSKQFGENGLLIAFICNHCPYVQAIADRFASDARELQGFGVNVIAIMPNDYQSVPEDGPEYMQRFSQQHRFNFPYLIDEHQEVARAFGAVCTPDFFGFNRSGKLQYRGRLDDARMQTSTQRTPELVAAMRDIAKTGQGPEQQTASMGCSIKWRDNHLL